VGDFNIDYLRVGDKSYQRHQLSEALLNFQVKNELTQMVKEITRHRLVTKNGIQNLQTSLLDHVYTNCLNIDHIQILPTIASDHDLLKINYDESNQKRKTKKKWIRDWRKYTKENFMKCLTRYNWDEILLTNDVTTLNDRIEQALKCSFDKVAPWTVIRERGRNFIADLNMRSLQKKRDSLYKQWKATKNEIIYNKVRELNAQIRYKHKQGHMASIKRKLETRNPKHFWNTVNHILGKEQKNIVELFHNNKLITDPNIMVDIFRSTFEKKIEENKAKIGQIEPDKSQPILELSNFNNDTISWSINEVEKAVKEFQTKRCTGHDELPIILYKDSFEITGRAITKLLNLVATSNTIPDNWRISKIFPVHKKGSKTSPENYRPISNICSISKIYERLILKYINGLEKRSGIIIPGNHQHGFMRNRSTTTACLTIQAKLAEKLELGKTMLLYSTDLSAAFDMLSPKLLEERLRNLNIPIQLRKILSDYVRNRAAYIDIENSTSDLFDINLGCVQGSILGPVIFSIFMQPLGQLHNDLTSYADDTYGIIELTDRDDLTNATKIISDHLKWLKSTGMIANEQKTEIMICHKTEKIVKDITIENFNIRTVNSMKILGILFNQNLDWSNHVTRNINSCQRILHGLKLVRKYFTEENFKTILTSFLFSKLFYAFEVWSYDLLNYHTKTLLDSFYYKCLRLIINDHQNLISRNIIDKKISRARPFEYSNFCLARTIIKTFTNANAPLHNLCTKTSYSTQRKPLQMFFYDSSKSKIGKNSIQNRLKFVFDSIKIPWLNSDFDKIRPILKSTFFEYHSKTQ